MALAVDRRWCRFGEIKRRVRANGAKAAKKRTESTTGAPRASGGSPAEDEGRSSPFADGIDLVDEDAYTEVEPGEIRGALPEGLARLNRSNALAIASHSWASRALEMIFAARATT